MRDMETSLGAGVVRLPQIKQGGQDALPWKRTLAILEFELHAEAGIERTLVARVRVAVDGGRTGSGWLQEISIADAEPGLSLLIDSQLRALVADVEQVSNQTQVLPFGDADGIVNVSIHAAKIRGAAQRAARGGAVRSVVRAERNLTSVLVSRMRVQVVDRNTRLEVDRAADREAFGVVAAKRVADEAIRQVTNIRVQHAGHELLSEQVEIAAGKVKQRADVRIILAVVIAERTFVVAKQLSNTVVRAHLPASRHRLVDFELHSPV